MDILRFITAGSVDDGKSTLIGRLLYDTDNIKTDILQSVTGSDDEQVNLAFITDGLRSERQQGITIDVAYKYFTTPHRKFIITDAPGHFQYTKNLVTGASGTDVMIILIDAHNGITDQTRRHSLVASFLKIGHVVIAVNKMDAVNFDMQTFTAIQNEYIEIANKLQLHNITFIPMSALLGDNVSIPSQSMKWYSGKTLLQFLESYIPVHKNINHSRCSIQYAIQSNEEDFKTGYAGKVLSGKFKINDTVEIHPQKRLAIIEKITNGYLEIFETTIGDNVCLYFTDNSRANRGDLISLLSDPPNCSNKLEATICWLCTDEPLQTNEKYLLRINSQETMCSIKEVVYKIDISTFEKYNDNKNIEVNQFAKVVIETDNVVAYDPYSSLQENGRGIIIDQKTNETCGAFVIEN